MKPSQLLRLALNDLTKAEADPRYTIDMTRWHMPLGDTCYVCLAGAMLAFSENIPIDQWVSSNLGVTEPVAQRMRALNDLRQGLLASGLAYFHHAVPNGLDHVRTITQYAYDPSRFKRDLHKLADDLESHGL